MRHNITPYTRLISIFGIHHRLLYGRRNQYEAAGSLAYARCHNDVTRCNRIDIGLLPWPINGTLSANITSFKKPEVHCVSKQATNDKLQSNVATYSRRGGVVVNNQIK